MSTISYGATDTGRVRDHNEDTFADTLIQTPGGAFHLLLVADGMGGHARGEVASAIASSTVREFLEFGAWHDPAAALRTAFSLANERVHEAGGDMGTTLVAALIEEATGQYWVHNVGDSRAYLVDRGELTPLTRDHSEIALRVEAGQLTRQEAASAKGRNVLLRAIGPESQLQSDGFGPYALGPGQRLLLCSDGLHGMLSEERLCQLAWAAPLGGAPKELIDAANEAGGTDNITVVVAAFAGDEPTVIDMALAAGARPRPAPLVLVAAAVAAFLAIGGVLAGFVFLVHGGGGDDKSVVAASPTLVGTSAHQSPPSGPTGAPPSPTSLRATATAPEASTTSVLSTTPDSGSGAVVAALPTPASTPTLTPQPPTSTLTTSPPASPSPTPTTNPLPTPTVAAPADVKATGVTVESAGGESYKITVTWSGASPSAQITVDPAGPKDCVRNNGGDQKVCYATFTGVQHGTHEVSVKVGDKQVFSEMRDFPPTEAKHHD